MSILIAFLIGSAVISVNSLFALFLANYDRVWVSLANILFGFACGVLLFGIGNFAMGEIKNDIAAVTVMLLLFIIGVAVAVLSYSIEKPLYIRKTESITLEQASLHPWSTVFSFCEGEVRTDLGSTSDIMGRSEGGSYTLGTAIVFPVVPKGWTKDREITVWAVATDKNIAEARSSFEMQAQQGVRVVGQNQNYYKKAMKLASEHHAIHSSPNAILVYWTQDAEKMIRSARIEWMWINIIANGVWGLLLLLYWIIRLSEKVL